MEFLFASFLGQEEIKEKMIPLMAAAWTNQYVFPHILLCGQPEMGKATFAHALANELKRQIRAIDALNIEKPADLTAILTNLKPLGILLLQEIDRLSDSMVERLVAAISKQQTEIIIGDRPHARSITMPLPNFTLFATTTYPSRIHSKLRRLMIQHSFASYSKSELTKLVILLANKTGRNIDAAAAALIADYCEGTVGNAEVLLKRAFSYCALIGESEFNYEIGAECLNSLGLREEGERIKKLSLEERLLRMTGKEFEEFIATLFQKRGYTVELTQASGDHGIDLLLRKGNRLEAVQCKRWNASVGEPVIRDFYGACFAIGAQLGHLVTTSSFTDSARLFAHGKPIQLIDISILLGMINSSD